MPKLRHKKNPHSFPTRPAHVQGAVGVGFTPEEYAIQETATFARSETTLLVDWTHNWLSACHALVEIQMKTIGNGFSVVDLPNRWEGFYVYDDTSRVSEVRIIRRPRDQKGHDHDEQA